MNEIEDDYEQRRVSFPVVDGILFPDALLVCHSCGRKITVGQPYKEMAAGPMAENGARLYALMCVYCDEIPPRDCCHE
jgi:hypothetical protein